MIRPLAGRPALVQAHVGVGVELAAPVEHADVVGAAFDDFSLALRQIRDLGDKNLRHDCAPD
jgi:hypothetical protein